MFVWIIAHCGLGPNEVDVTEYETRLDTLLAYDRVRFDLSGMQVGTLTGKLIDPILGITPVAAMLLAKIKDYPDRFLWGLDVETRTGGSTADWEQEVDSLEFFLDAGMLTNEEKRMVKRSNAQGILS